MKDSLLSIVLIAQKNSSFYFIRALESAINQTYPAKEILVVDANIPDSPYSFGLLEDLAQYPEVILLRPDRSGTNSFYRNFALKQVKGEYVAFMGGSDVWMPEKALLQVEQLKTDDSFGASCSNGIILYEHPQSITSELFFEKVSDDVREWVLEKPVQIGSQVIYRTNPLQEMGGFEDKLGCYGDLDAIMRLREKHQIMFFPVILFKTYAASDEDHKLRKFMDGQLLMQKYEEFFLLNRRAAYDYYIFMAMQAAENCMWVKFASYLAMSFLKAPMHFWVRLAAGLIHTAARAIRLSIQNGVLWFCKLELLRSVKADRNGKQKLRWSKENLVPQAPAGTEWEILDGLTAKDFSQYPTFHFAGNHKLRSIMIPDHVAVLKKGMFSCCDHLVSVVIPNTVTKIEGHVFQGCRSLKTVTFQSGSRLAEIGAYAFAGCSSLTVIQLPNTIMRIGIGTFAECTMLQRFEFTSLSSEGEIVRPVFPNSLSIVPRYAFTACTGLQEIIFDEGSMLKSIDTAAFYHCSELETVQMTGAIDRIKAYAFAGCEKLSHLGMPLIDAVNEIGSYAFADCRSLTQVHIPDALKRINKRTYYGCTALQSVKIPAGVLKIKREAFGQCSSLQSAMLTNAATVYPSSAFPKETKIDAYNPNSKDDYEQ